MSFETISIYRNSRILQKLPRMVLYGHHTMKQSELFSKTSKEPPKDAVTVSHKLLARGDFIDQLASGIYSFLPLGLRVHQKIQGIIRQELNVLGAQEISMPTLQPRALWEETKRWETIDPPLFVVKDRHKRELALGPTHEEVITDLVRRRVRSYKDLPFAVYQMQTKFRNEMRSTGGLLRTREFMMKDLYSFHADETDLGQYYAKVREAYTKIFSRCGLETIPVHAHSGTIGGSFSQEFMTLAENGEDTIIQCGKCGYAANVEKSGKVNTCPECKQPSIEIKSCIESGHIFELGTKYSAAMGAVFSDEKGTERPIHMGCYGIGIGRLIATIVEVHNDKYGIIWPKEVAPFLVHLLYLPSEKPSVGKEALKLYDLLQKEGFQVLYDDRTSMSAGEKFAEADLLGVPMRVVVSERTGAGRVEVKMRGTKDARILSVQELLRML